MKNFLTTLTIVILTLFLGQPVNGQPYLEHGWTTGSGYQRQFYVRTSNIPDTSGWTYVVNHIYLASTSSVPGSPYSTTLTVSQEYSNPTPFKTCYLSRTYYNMTSSFTINISASIIVQGTRFKTTYSNGGQTMLSESWEFSAQSLNNILSTNPFGIPVEGTFVPYGEYWNTFSFLMY